MGISADPEIVDHRSGLNPFPSITSAMLNTELFRPVEEINKDSSSAAIPRGISVGDCIRIPRWYLIRLKIYN
jgi:hypothetical protein